MSETSRISITDHRVHRRVSDVMSAFRTKAAKEKERKAFLSPKGRKREVDKGKEAVKPRHRMYLKPEEYIRQHGKPGENIIK